MTDPDRIAVSPDYIKALSFAKGHYENSHGRVDVLWKRDEERIFLDVKVSGKLSVSVKTDENVKVNITTDSLNKEERENEPKAIF